MKRKVKFMLSLIVVGFMLLLVSNVFARGPEGTGQNPIYKTAQDLDPIRTLSNINNWSYWMYYDGESGLDPDNNAGGIYPRGTAGVIFEDGFVWGCKVDGKIQVGGQTYSIGTEPLLDRIYRIRSDWKKLLDDPSPLRQDASEFFRVPNASVTADQMEQLAAQYAKDWKEWPVDQGAPYYDVDGNGEYNPVLDDQGYPIAAEYDENGKLTAGGDYPGIANADQIIYLRVDDQDSARTVALYGSDPIGLELQVTAWGYNQTSSQLGQIIFKKYRLINISGKKLDDMYVAQWCDPDVGNSTDDVVGCDPELGIGFAYNGTPTDDNFAELGLAPSAIGYDFFQGPIVDGVKGEDINQNGIDDAEDYAVFNLKKVGPGKVNMPMTSFGYFSAGNPEWEDPTLKSYDGTLEWYNLLRGYITTNDVDNPTPFTHRATGEPTKFPLDGDPVTGIGDIDGNPGLKNFAPADRRMSLSTGPFTMMPGDTQEVVVAIIGGESGKLGVGSRTQSVFALKVNDEIAQMLYNTLFTQVPKPPSPPKVKITPLEDKIAINWSFDNDAVINTENPVLADYSFEGYNVYQLPSAKSGLSDAVRVATFDKVDNVKKIIETRFLPQYGQGVNVPIRFGNDTGVKRYFIVDKDYIKDEPLHPGNTYFFAVTAYNYNPTATVVKSLESSIQIIPVTTQAALPGYSEGSTPGEDLTNVTHSKGSAEQASVNVKVVDPAQITGDDYSVYFEPWFFYLDLDGKWKRTASPDSVVPVGKMAKIADVSPSTITGAAVTSTNVGTVDLIFTLNLVAPGGDWVDGLKITLPSGIKVNSWKPVTGAYGDYGTGQGQNVVNTEGTYDPTDNSITWGDSARSTFGAIEGTVYMTINVDMFTPPLTAGFTVYDDGYDGNIVDATGTITIPEIGYSFKTVDMWGLKDITANKVVLEGQDKLYNDVTNDAPVVDGMQVIVGGSYEAPTDFSSVKWNGEDISDFAGAGEGVGSYGIYGWGATARAIDTYGQGTTDLNMLIKDYVLRWTGDYDTTVTTGGDTLVSVVSGGSMAYLIGARKYDLKDNPFNPNPGSSDPFMVRVPFEVWDAEDGYQCNFLIYDRMQDPSSSKPFYAFNPNDRMYTYFLLTPYKETAPSSASLDSLTWNLVWWTAPMKKGDSVYVKYANPIILGSDEFTFSTQGLGQTYSVAQEKAAVEKVTVYPNPYYANNPRSVNRFDKFITFYHLPKKATIRLFTLAGDQVRKLVKNDDTQFYNWDLKNERGLPVASGIYFAHIEMTLSDGSKVTKVLKVFIIQRAQMLKYY